MAKRQLLVNRELAYVGSDRLDANGDIKLSEEKDTFTLDIGPNKFVGLTLIEASEALQHLEILRHMEGFVYCGKPGRPQKVTSRRGSAFPNSAGHRKGSSMVYGAICPRPSATCPICLAALHGYLRSDDFNPYAGQIQAYIR